MSVKEELTVFISIGGFQHSMSLYHRLSFQNWQQVVHLLKSKLKFSNVNITIGPIEDSLKRTQVETLDEL